MTNMWERDDDLIGDILEWANQRIHRDPNPDTGARPASALDAQIGQTITPEGIGGQEALRIFKDEMLPATRAMDHPLNLAFIPSSPTPTAVAFDVAVSAASIFGGLWETGAGAIWAENQALRWLADLAGWGPEAGGVFVSGGTIANLSALTAARSRALIQRDGVRPDRWVLAATSEAHSSIKEAAAVMDCEVLLVPANRRGAM
ncbi:MAG: pyridoxal-dependent decarboxylase, partial [Acidimicrobiales bacterium]